jgi:hypothetical protein
VSAGRSSDIRQDAVHSPDKSNEGGKAIVFAVPIVSTIRFSRLNDAKASRVPKHIKSDGLPLSKISSMRM